MEQVLYVIGQLLGGVCVVLGFINYQVKTRKQVLVVNASTTLCFAFHYMLLGAWAGMAMNFVGFVRNIVFYFAGKNGKINKIWPIFFTIIIGSMGITASLIAKEGLYFCLSVAGLMINTYSMSFPNPSSIRKSILVSSPLVLAYNVFVSSWGGAIYEAVVIISSIIGILRFREHDNGIG